MSAHSTNPVLMTDHYEYTMLDALVLSGKVNEKAVFEVFSRDLKERSYGVFAGLLPLMETIEKFTFSHKEISFLESINLLSAETLRWLEEYSFSGKISAYREGELYFPFSPVMTVEAEIGEALILETIILSFLNHASAVATAAARITESANGKFVMEAGSRRVNPESAVQAARAAYIAGIDVTSNLETSRRWGIPTAGTASHAFTLSFPNELEAFEAQTETLGKSTIFLVDTYNQEDAIKSAVKDTGGELKGIRLDSGNLGEDSIAARELLDSLGAIDAQIMVSGDLDEYKIADLTTYPIDSFESGHRLVTGSGVPSAGFVYKLVAITDGTSETFNPVAKKATGKTNQGGRKFAKRLLSDEGFAVEEVITTNENDFLNNPDTQARELQTVIFQNGEIFNKWNVHEARAHCRAVIKELPKEKREIHFSSPAIPTTFKEV